MHPSIHCIESWDHLCVSIWVFALSIHFSGACQCKMFSADKYEMFMSIETQGHFAWSETLRLNCPQTLQWSSTLSLNGCYFAWCTVLYWLQCLNRVVNDQWICWLRLVSPHTRYLACLSVCIQIFFGVCLTLLNTHCDEHNVTVWWAEAETSAFHSWNVQ